MQEQVIKDLINLMRKSVKDVSLSFIAKSQEHIELAKNPLSMIDVQRNSHDRAGHSSYSVPAGSQRGEEPLLPTGSQRHDAATRGD